MTEGWIHRKDEFLTIDLRAVTADMLPSLLTRAQAVALGAGLHIIQRYEPLEYYTPLKELGFEYQLIKVSDQEYHVYFHRVAAERA